MIKISEARTKIRAARANVFFVANLHSTKVSVVNRTVGNARVKVLNRSRNSRLFGTEE